MDVTGELEAKLPPPRDLDTKEALDEATANLMDAIQTASLNHSPTKRFIKFTRTGIDKECSDLKKQCRKAQRKWNKHHNRRDWNNPNQASEQEGTHDQSLPTEGMEGLWSLNKQLKSKFAPQPSFTPPLRKAANSTDLAFSTEDKAEALKQACFSPVKGCRLGRSRGLPIPGASATGTPQRTRNRGSHQFTPPQQSCRTEGHHFSGPASYVHHRSSTPVWN
ncbi:hypothetical protein XPA_010560 [Xanthoria parietina]